MEKEKTTIERILNIVEEAEKKHISKIKLCKEAGINITTLYRWRKRISSPIINNFNCLEDALKRLS